MAKVDICLATYNGAAWLPEFLASLDQQDFRDWRLVVSDDGSTDQTLEILRSHFSREPHRLYLVPRERTRTGVIGNFRDVLAASAAEYVFPADQDDIWLPHKLGEMLVAIEKSGSRGEASASSVPALVYSDMQVVDSDLKLISASLWRLPGISADAPVQLRHLLVQSNVPGCSMVVNRALLRAALPIPDECVMHDYWLLMVCLLTGRVDRIPSANVLYRRHEAAATYRSMSGWRGKLHRIVSTGSEVREHFRATVRQAACVLKRMDGGLTPAQRELLRAYVRAGNGGWLMRRLVLLKWRFRKKSWAGTIRMYMWI